MQRIKTKRSAEKGISLKRSLITSALVHLVLISAFVLIPADLFIKRSPPMDITWVELPKGTGDDIYGIKETKELPKSTIQEQIEPLVPPKEDVKAMAEPKPKKEEKKEEKPVKKAEKKQPAPSKMDQALAKIDKKLKDREVPKEAAQIDSTGEGFVYGTTEKPNRVARDDPEYLRYVATIRAKVMSQWSVPNIPPDEKQNLTINLYINKSGYVTSKSWIKKSRLEAYNASAMRAIDRAQPFPIPPERIKWEAYNEGFTVQFRPR